MKKSSERNLILYLFFFIGFGSLIYEICWVRAATLTFGVSIFAYSVVLTAYMGGMAIGSILIGKWADRTPRPWAVMAWLQVGLAMMGLITPFALHGMASLYATIARNLAPGIAVLTMLRLSLAVLTLTPPAIFIGAGFPLISRLYARQRGQVGSDVGRLYAVNTLG